MSSLTRPTYVVLEFGDRNDDRNVYTGRLLAIVSSGNREGICIRL